MPTTPEIIPSNLSPDLFLWFFQEGGSQNRAQVTTDMSDSESPFVREIPKTVDTNLDKNAPSKETILVTENGFRQIPPTTNSAVDQELLRESTLAEIQTRHSNSSEMVVDSKIPITVEVTPDKQDLEEEENLRLRLSPSDSEESSSPDQAKANKLEDTPAGSNGRTDSVAGTTGKSDSNEEAKPEPSAGCEVNRETSGTRKESEDVFDTASKTSQESEVCGFAIWISGNSIHFVFAFI